jgi:hypothetical protein
MYDLLHHLCQPYRSFGKRQRTILSGTTCAVRVQSGVRNTKLQLLRCATGRKRRVTTVVAFSATEHQNGAAL